MSGELSTEWSFSGVLVRLYATVCETSPELPDLEAFLLQYPHIDRRQHADVLLFDQYFRWRIDCPRPIEWYFDHFADLKSPSNWRLELVLEEFGYLEEHDFQRLLAQAEEVGRVVGGLRVSIEKLRDSRRD